MMSSSKSDKSYNDRDGPVFQIKKKNCNCIKNNIN
jgi:hypothetical protein